VYEKCVQNSSPKRKGNRLHGGMRVERKKTLRCMREMWTGLKCLMRSNGGLRERG
jgi:hypothetical protein